MALETERCSPNNASSPGPTDNNRRPGMDDCSDQTKELSPSPPPPLPSASVDDAAEQQQQQQHAPVHDASSLLACSKPLSICSPLQNKTAADYRLQTSSPPLPPPPPLPPQHSRPQPAANRKKPVHKPPADVPRWIHQQQQHTVAQQNNEPPALVAPHSTAAAAAAAVEYTMAVAAAAAGHVPPVFPFNSWMYRLNFLPIVPAAAAEYFREMHHHHQHHQNGGSPEIDERQPPHHPHLPLHHYQHHHYQQQQQLQQLTHHRRADLSQPQPVPPQLLPPQLQQLPRSATGYVSRPASTSGSSDVSSSCGNGNGGGGMTMAASVAGGVMTATKNRYRSPSPRSPSPFPLAFSVDNILRPEFGSKLGLRHHGGNNNNNTNRSSSASPPSPVSAAVKLHYNFVANKSAQQSFAPLQLQSSPSLVQPVTQHPSLHRPAPTRPNAASVAGPKRPAPVTAVQADKAKRKAPVVVPPLPRSCSPIDNNNSAVNGDGNRLKPDDSANNNNNNNDDDQESDATGASGDLQQSSEKEMWPAWVYCTRYSDRPSSGKRKPLFFSFIVL